VRALRDDDPVGTRVLAASLLRYFRASGSRDGIAYSVGVLTDRAPDTVPLTEGQVAVLVHAGSLCLGFDRGQCQVIEPSDLDEWGLVERDAVVSWLRAQADDVVDDAMERSGEQSRYLYHIADHCHDIALAIERGEHAKAGDAK